MSFQTCPPGVEDLSRQASPSDPVNDAEFSEDFELIEEMEWGPRRGEEGYDTDQELAPRPQKSAASEKCGCIPPLTGMGCNDEETCILFACREECRSNCDLGHLCGNKRLTKKQFAEIEVFSADRKGKGLRLCTTSAPVKKGDLLCEYLGRAIRQGALNRLFRRYQFDRRLYILSLGNGIFVDARKKGGVARFINHSCNPNCKVELWKVKGIMRAAVVALRQIQPGEEICFDYQWERKRGRAPTVCHCGEENCRGTLEMVKSQAESTMEEELEGHWERFNAPPEQTIVNRTVKVFSKEHQEYFMGDVTGFDAQRGLHCVLYHQDMNEMWEDLAKEDWMILDEKVDENFMIAKKVQRRNDSEKASLLEKAKPSVSQPGKNFHFVQLPVKEALVSQGLVDRCQRNFNVLIDIDEFGRPPLPPNIDDPEDVEKYKALDASNESTVWRLSIRGANVGEAYNFLERTIGGIQKKLASASDEGQNFLSAAVETYKQEMIFPRAIADGVKRNIQNVKEKCQSVTIAFIASESRSKRFGRVTLEAAASADNEKAMELLWKMCADLCNETKTEKTSNDVHRDLGFLGCLLSAEEFTLLAASSSRGELGDQTLNGSPFISSFERIFKCSVWVQDPDDQGRINSRSRLVGGITQSSPRKVFFGCEPCDLSRLASTIKDRVMDLSRGVQYLHLGSDRVFMKLMSEHNFFDFVSSITGAAVSVDPMTGDHMRIDGRPSVIISSTENDVSERKRAALAEEILRLQVEYFKLECIRQQSWMFGRDWSLAFLSKQSSDSTNGAAVGILAEHNAGQCCLDIAEIVDRLNLPPFVSGHASIILYRYTISNQMTASPMKTREATLAVCNIANKSQTANKWKPLFHVLQAGYGVVYPGAEFDSKSEETKVLGERVAAAEQAILSTLQFDVFWESIECIRLATTGGGKMRPAFVDDIFKLVFSGQFLSAGAELWLRFETKYIFAVAAAFLKADLRTLVATLSLKPFKVSQAASLLVQSSSFVKNKNYAHLILGNGKGYFEAQATKIEAMCMDMINETTRPDLSLSDEERRYLQICEESREILLLANIDSITIKQMIPQFEAVEAESSCFIRIRPSKVSPNAADILLGGAWRATACAEHLLRTKAACGLPKGIRQYHSNGEDGAPKEMAKAQPGVVSSNGIMVSDGWKGTIQYDLAPFKTSGRFGGKCCMPSSVKESFLRDGGLSWWIPPKRGACVSGSIRDLVGIVADDPIETIAVLAQSIAADPASFPQLYAVVQDSSMDDRCVAISIQRWPSKKVEDKEVAIFKKSKQQLVGFSAAALQEMQLLKQLHFLVPSSRGHPNFILPLGIAKVDPDLNRGPDKSTEPVQPESIFSILKSSDENNKTAERKKRIESCEHLIFEPSPFILQRFMSRKNWPDQCSVTKPLISAWFYDCISMLIHCHSNQVLLRSIAADNIIVSQCGVLKIGGLYRSTVISAKDQRKVEDPIEAARAAFKLAKGDKRKKDRKRKRKESKRKPGNRHSDDTQHFDVNSAPEILLG